MAFIFFRNNFKLTSMLQEYYQLPYTLHPDSPIVLSFKHFKVAIHYLLASKFSDMKLLVVLIFVPLHVCVFLSFIAFEIFLFITELQQFDYNVPWNGFFVLLLLGTY